MRPKAGNRRKGYDFEIAAQSYLVKQGLQALQHGFYSKFGEIDLVMKDKSTLVFVEIKYRKNNHFGEALETITRSKQKKLIMTAKYYLLSNKWASKLDCRFDAVAVNQCTRTSTLDFCWIKGAFDSFI